MVVRHGGGMTSRSPATAPMFRGLPETVGRSRTRSSVLVRDDVSGWLVAAGAVCPTCWTDCTSDPWSPEGGGYLQETPMLKLAWVFYRFLVESEYELYLGAPVYL